MTNDNDYTRLDPWLFFYDSYTNTWNAVLKDDYYAGVKNPKKEIEVIKSTSMDYLINFITTTNDTVN